MRDKELDRAFGDTPPAFTGRINQTLAQLEDKPRRIPRLRTALVLSEEFQQGHCFRVVADKKKPAAPGKVATQDTDVALLAALVAHSKATQPKLSPTEVKLRQCNKLGSVAEAEDCRAKLCAGSGGKEASCHSVPVAKASDEA